MKACILFMLGMATQGMIFGLAGAAEVLTLSPDSHLTAAATFFAGIVFIALFYLAFRKLAERKTAFDVPSAEKYVKLPFTVGTLVRLAKLGSAKSMESAERIGDYFPGPKSDKFDVIEEALNRSFADGIIADLS